MSTRVVNVKDGAPYDVYIGRANRRYGLRASKWANPFKIGLVEGNGAAYRVQTREQVIALYRGYVLGSLLRSSLPELRGKTLACWCAPLACHGDVLAELADSLPSPDAPR